MSTDIGIDLGTYKTIVYIKSRGIIFNEPSVIAYNVKTKDVIAVGKEAYEMIGKTPPYIKTVRPILNGVIADYDFAEKMMASILKKNCYLKIFKPRIAICVPSIVTTVEKNAIVDAAINIGARIVYIIDEPIAAAIGEGIDISKPKGRLVVDIGGGSTDIALISLNGIVAKNSIRVAGDDFDEAIIKKVKDLYNLDIGFNMARKIKEQIGTVLLENKNCELFIEAKGKDYITGLPKKQNVFARDFIDVFDVIASQIIKAIKKVVEKTPPDLLGDVQSGYLLMTGGGSKLKGLRERVEKDIKLKTLLPSNAVEAVAIGTGNCFALIKEIDDGLIEQNVYKR